MPKFISGKDKRKALLDLAKRDKKSIDVAKSNNMSIGTLYRIKATNRKMYDDIVNDIKMGVRNRALLTADRAIKNIKNDKLKASSGLQLSQIASNLNSIYEDKNASQVNIQVNIPKDRTSLEAFILGNESANIPPISVSASKSTDQGVKLIE